MYLYGSLRDNEEFTHTYTQRKHTHKFYYHVVFAKKENKISD